MEDNSASTESAFTTPLSCEPASDGTLDNLTWCLLQPQADVDSGDQIGLWVQIARYVPPVLVRLRKSEQERDTLLEALHEFRDLQQRLLALAHLAAMQGQAIDPVLLIDYLTGRKSEQ